MCVAKIKRIKQTPKLLRVCITDRKSGEKKQKQTNKKKKHALKISKGKYLDTLLLKNIMLLRR